MVAGVVAMETGFWAGPELSELATEGSSPKPGLVRLLSICIAAAAACLVTLSSSSDWACRGEPEFLTIHICPYSYLKLMFRFYEQEKLT
jgi:hypothetical protein